MFKIRFFFSCSGTDRAEVIGKWKSGWWNTFGLPNDFLIRMLNADLFNPARANLIFPGTRASMRDNEEASRLKMTLAEIEERIVHEAANREDGGVSRSERYRTDSYHERLWDDIRQSTESLTQRIRAEGSAPMKR